MYGIQDKINQILRGAETIKKNSMNPNTTPTPRTEIYVLNPHPQCVPAEFARELERENTKLREIVERYRVWATSENPTQMELDDLKQKYDELN